MLRRYVPFQSDHLYLSDSETDSDDLNEYVSMEESTKMDRGIYVGKENYRQKREEKRRIVEAESGRGMKELKEESDIVFKKAKKYQEYMKQIPIPTLRGLPISFTTWQGLGKFMKQIYEQPLHYMTYKLLKQWDQSQIESQDESKTLDLQIDPNQAESAIWVMEEFHRRCTSHVHLAKLWLSNPLYHEFIDPVVDY